MSQSSKRKLDEIESTPATTAPEVADKKPKLAPITDVIAVDVETSGPNLVKHFMPEFAGELITIGEQEPRESFYRALQQPNNTGWSSETLKSFWEKPDADGVKPITAFDERRKTNKIHDCYTAMDEFVDWVREMDAAVSAKGGRLLIVTDTAGFDVAWIDTYLSRYSSKATSLGDILGRYQPTRDISSFMLGVSGAIQTGNSVEAAIQALGLSSEANWGAKFAHNHDPASDAKHIAATASFILSNCKTK